MSSDMPGTLESPHHAFVAGMDVGVTPQLHGCPNLNISDGSGSTAPTTRQLPPASELLSSTSSSSPFNFSSSTGGRYFGSATDFHSSAGYYDSVGAQPTFSNLVQLQQPLPAQPHYQLFDVGVNSIQQSPRSLPPPSPYTTSSGETFRQALTEPATPAMASIYPPANPHLLQQQPLATGADRGTFRSLDELAGLQGSVSAAHHQHQQLSQQQRFDVSAHQQLQQFRIPTPINPYAPTMDSNVVCSSGGVPPAPCYQSPSAEQEKSPKTKRGRVSLAPTTPAAAVARTYSIASPLTILSAMGSDEGPTVKEHIQKQQAELRRLGQQQLLLKHRQQQKQRQATSQNAAASQAHSQLISPEPMQSSISASSHQQSTITIAAPAMTSPVVSTPLAAQLAPVPVAAVRKQRKSRNAPTRSKADGVASRVQQHDSTTFKFPDDGVYSTFDHHDTSNDGGGVGGGGEEENDTLSSIIASVASGASGSLRSLNKSLGSRPDSPLQQPCFFEPTSSPVKIAKCGQRGSSPQKPSPGRRAGKQCGSSSSFSSPSKSVSSAAGPDTLALEPSSYTSPQFTRIHVQNAPSDCDFPHTATTIHVVRSDANEPTVRDLVKSPLLFHPVTIIGGRVKPSDRVTPTGHSSLIGYSHPEASGAPGTRDPPHNTQPQHLPSKKATPSNKRKVKVKDAEVSGERYSTLTAGPLFYNTQQGSQQRLHVIQPYSVIANDSKAAVPDQVRAIGAASRGADTPGRQTQEFKPTITDVEGRDEFRKYSIKYYHLHRTLKSLVYFKKNAALCDELARLRQRIYTVTEERRLLAKRLQHHERNRARRVQAQKRKAEYRAKRRVEKFLHQDSFLPMPGEDESVIGDEERRDDQSASVSGGLNDSLGNGDMCFEPCVKADDDLFAPTH